VTTPTGPRVPLATYRLQLGREFTFDDAAGLVPYLEALGISDCYTSPFFEANSQSTHGYDVSDHNRIRDELGGEPAFVRFAETLRRHGLGLLIDLVPNHMGIAKNRNAWWLDVLENGPASRYAHVFDIDWKPAKPELAGKVLLPILGDQYGAVLERGELRLELNDGVFTIRYHDTVLPVAPHAYGRILSDRIDELQAALGPEHPGLLELEALTAWFVALSPRAERDAEWQATRKRDKGQGIERLALLLRQSSEVRTFVENNVHRFNGTPHHPRSFDLLDGLLGDQAYRIAFWRVAGEEINYRRFFDINELAAIRMEDPEVFAETHWLVFRLVGEGRVTGLRVDHPDGLYAPAEYFRRLQRGCARVRSAATPGEGGDVYIVAEKILTPGESLPRTWAVAGTTGYEFLNLLNGIFVDRSQARAMEHLYARLIKERPPFAEVVCECKRLVMQTSMASELNMLAHRLNAIAEKHRSSRDFTLMSLTRALAEIIANFPVYRTYVGEDERGISDRDREYIARAVAQAKRRTPLMNASIHEWIQDILTLRLPPGADDADRRGRLEFALRFQQFTAPVTAKGYEDTALYRFNRLVSLNEVGGDPSRFGTPPAEFHAAMVERQRAHPHGLSATSTHDTKRGEDVRARINVLSEIPHEWRRRVAVWQKLNRKHRTVVDGRPTPGANTEYLIYQTLVGAWPIGVDRLRSYLFKAVHEAKSHTSWVNPNVRYNEAIVRFAEGILDPARSSRFLDDFVAFQSRVAHFGTFSSLGQTLVKITAPGVPDFYQGSELWDLNLVDPDNRRPVDWRLRQRMLDELTTATQMARDRAAFAQELVKTKEDGRVKLYVICEALACRRAQPALYREGEYRPLETQGPLAEHILAFARLGKDAAALTIVPRLLARRGIEELPLGRAYWGDETRVLVPPEAGPRFLNPFTGERVAVEKGVLPLARTFASFPVALLVTDASG
jgi:(1->4)-alpha-D-glucan 1-alpha-D-glucosylmutase